MDVKATANGLTYPQSKFFQACRGVFEGGGCRGAGHVGAYEAAIKCGINFSEVAGTSAGSIITALIAAGADPDYLLKTCAYLKFSELLAKPKGRIGTPLLARIASFGFRGSKKLFGKILRNGSAYSSEKLQEWVDDRLAELLPEAARPIKFKDLILPTWIVATDLAGRRPKIWSTEETPDESVALAVRCSCSIPLFFEPVELGNDLYVDGGMLSNLPAFVFADRGKNPLALGGRILAFQLSGNETHKTEWTAGWLVNRLIDTAISGAVTIQRKMQSNVSSLAIKTGSVSSTNFDISKEEVDFLLQSGRKAVSEFVADEHAKLNDALAVDVARYGEDELLDDVVREMALTGKRLIMADVDTKWFWALFPSVAHWLFAGAAVDVLVTPGVASPRELQRRQLLKAMGARVIEISVLPFVGYLLSRTDDTQNAAFVLNISQSQYAPIGTVYVGLKHRPMIASLLAAVDASIGRPDARQSRKLSLQKSDTGKLVALMKAGVNQYSAPATTIELEEISLADSARSAKMIVQRIRSYKYRQIASLAALYERFNMPLFAPVDVLADGEYVSTVMPPVFETWGNSLVAIEGNTRLYHMHRTGIDKCVAFVAKGVTAPLPGIPVLPRQALLSTYDLALDVRIKGFSRDNFRAIEGAVRPES